MVMQSIAGETRFEEEVARVGSAHIRNSANTQVRLLGVCRDWWALEGDKCIGTSFYTSAPGAPKPGEA